MMPLVMANEAGRAHAANLEALCGPPNCSLERRHRPRPSLKFLGIGETEKVRSLYRVGSRPHDALLQSRVAWDCSLNWEVNSF